MNKELLELFEAQIGHEFGAAHTYLSMAGYFEEKNLTGFAQWMRHQSEEETEHAMKIFNFLVENGFAPRLPDIPKPPHDFDGPVAVFKASLEHEQKVTRQINALYELAVDTKHYPSQVLLQWFITEQLEEEATASGILERLEMVEGSGAALLLLDSELGQRTGDDHDD